MTARDRPVGTVPGDGSDLRPDADDWRRAASGDPEAFGAVFDRHRDRVFGLALRLLGHRHDAEDATALVFLEAWRRRGSVRVVDGSVLPWLLVTTGHVAQNASRARRRHRLALAELPPSEVVDDHADDVAARVDGAGRDGEVRSALRRLRPADRDVLLLCVVQELSLDAASVVLDVPLGTVKSRLSRARARLADETRRLLAADGPWALTADDTTSPSTGETR